MPSLLTNFKWILCFFLSFSTISLKEWDLVGCPRASLFIRFFCLTFNSIKQTDQSRFIHIELITRFKFNSFTISSSIFTYNSPSTFLFLFHFPDISYWILPLSVFWSSNIFLYSVLLITSAQRWLDTFNWRQVSTTKSQFHANICCNVNKKARPFDL